MAVKNYVLDTNILLQTEGRVLMGFSDNIVTIPGMVLEELDKKKTASGELGYSAREVLRKIEKIKERPGDFSFGYILNDNNGRLKAEINSDMSYLPAGWDKSSPDNIILGTLMYLVENNKVMDTILITNDISMQIKASLIGVSVQGYKNDQIDTEVLYSGRKELYASADTINSLFHNPNGIGFMDTVFYEENKSIPLTNIEKENLITKYQNIFFVIKNFENTSSALAYLSGDKLISIDKKCYGNISGISPKNTGQTFAINALMRPVDDTPFVILKGCAGTGKTILSLAAGLKQMNAGMYDKIIITRSNTLSDEELGFLPGDLEEKMTPLLAPFYDNLRFLFRLSGEDEEQIEYLLDDMLERRSIEIVSLAYIRGRSIPNAFIIIDECQNLSITQAKTIVTRAGIGTKIVFLGDPGQIDNPKLDKKNNGLVYLSEKFTGSRLCSQIEFSGKESVRSPLASEAIRLLE